MCVCQRYCEETDGHVASSHPLVYCDALENLLLMSFWTGTHTYIHTHTHGCTYFPRISILPPVPPSSCARILPRVCHWADGGCSPAVHGPYPSLTSSGATHHPQGRHTARRENHTRIRIGVFIGIGVCDRAKCGSGVGACAGLLHLSRGAGVVLRCWLGVPHRLDLLRAMQRPLGHN